MFPGPLEAGAIARPAFAQPLCRLEAPGCWRLITDPMSSPSSEIIVLLQARNDNSLR